MDSERPVGERGQASVELVAVLPALVVCTLIAGHLVAAGWALWSAGNAARAGARAELVGGDVREAARSALPGPLRRGAAIDQGARTRVSVRVPALLPGARLGRLSTASGLDVEDD